MEPLVTVITASYNRPLGPVIDSVAEQSYPNIEHIIIVDGDSGLWAAPAGVRVLNLGRNWQSVAEHWGAIPRAVGGYLAHGDLICYLDDDNTYLPHHVETLVWLLLTEDADCAASAQDRGPEGILTPALEYAHIDTSMVMHRAELLGTDTWRAAGYTSDWDLFSRWKDHRWAFTDEVTSLYWPS